MTSIQVRQVKEDLQSEKVQSPERRTLLSSREGVTWWVCAWDGLVSRGQTLAGVPLHYLWSGYARLSMDTSAVDFGVH